MLFSLVDGIDAALIELIRDELGAEQFVSIAETLAAETFAAARATEQERQLLFSVFQLRAQRLIEMRSSGRLTLARETSARPRLVDAVLDGLLPRYADWESIESPLDPHLVHLVVDWALEQPGFAEEAEIVYRGTGVTDLGISLSGLLLAWLEGLPFTELAVRAGVGIDVLLRIHAKLVLFDFVTLVEQAVAILQRHLTLEGVTLAPAVASLPDFARFGVSTTAARELMAKGVRHRAAAVELGAHSAMSSPDNLFSLSTPWTIARDLLADIDTWLPRLGDLVYQRTVADVAIRRFI